MLDGDITDPWVGLEEAQVSELTGKVHAFINCAGLVSFNPSLEVGLNVNTHGVKFAVDLAHPALELMTVIEAHGASREPAFVIFLAVEDGAAVVPFRPWEIVTLVVR